MKKSILAVALTLAFSLAAFAQSSYGGSSSTSGQSTAKTSKTRTSASSGKEHAVTGCLEQGASTGSYVIKNAKHPDGVQVSYSGSEDLSKHVGHKVKAMGSMSGSTLNATDVKHISETCSVSGGEASMSHGHQHDTSTKGTSTSNPDTGTKPDSSAPAPK